MIVRYLTDDPPGSSARAREFLDRVDQLFVPEVVIAEVGFLLTTFYAVTRQRAVDQMAELLNRQNILPLVLDRALALEAVDLCRPSNRVSFADALTWAAARQSGIGVVYSYDRRFPSDGIEVRRE